MLRKNVYSSYISCHYSFVQAFFPVYFQICIFINPPPLQVRSDYCKLSWDAPEDDGGTAITQYTVAMMDLSVNQWVTAAETKDRSAGIQGLKPGHLYRYTVIQLDSKIPIILYRVSQKKCPHVLEGRSTPKF